jgi:hypothetical protein
MAVTVGRGDLVYLDTFSGLVPAKYLGPSGLRDEAGRELPRVKITGTRAAYTKGERVCISPTQVVPRHLVRRSGSHFVIRCEEVLFA